MHRHNGQWYYGYGGLYVAPSYAVGTEVMPAAVTITETRPCQRVQQPITVRSEDGGTRVISITRCQN